MTKIYPDIILTTDFSRFDTYDKYTIKRYGYKYSDLIKKEQKFLKRLIETKYGKTISNDNLVILIMIHSDFGSRKEKDYKVVVKYSPSWYTFMNTDDYDEVGKFNEIKTFLQNYDTN